MGINTTTTVLSNRNPHHSFQHTCDWNTIQMKQYSRCSNMLTQAALQRVLPHIKVLLATHIKRLLFRTQRHFGSGKTAWNPFVFGDASYCGVFLGVAVWLHAVFYIRHVRPWWQYPHCAKDHKKCGFPSWVSPFFSNYIHRLQQA